MIFTLVTIKANAMENASNSFSITDIKEECMQGWHHLKTKRETKQLLCDPKKFKATRTVRNSNLALLAENLEDFVTPNYLLVRRRVHNKTVKTYVYLVFRNFAKLDWMRTLVHRIVPLIETDVQCIDYHCPCRACASKLVRGIKRRGFGYIKEEDIETTVDHLIQQGYDCSLRGLPPTRAQRRTLRSQTEVHNSEDAE